MSRYMSVVWVAQILVVLVLSLVLLARPQIIPELLDGCTYAVSGHGNEHLYGLEAEGAPQKDCEVDTYVQTQEDYPAWREVRFVLASGRLLVPFLFLMALFSLHAFMREDLRVRRRLARIFAVTGCLLFYLLVLPLHERVYPSFFLLLYLLYELMREDPSMRRRLVRIAIVSGGLLACSLMLKLFGRLQSHGEDAFISFLHCASNSLRDHAARLDLKTLKECGGNGFGILLAQSKNSDALFENLSAAHPRRAMLFGCVVLLAFFVVSNFVFSLWPLPRAARRLSGSADTLPPRLWVLWLIQGTFFILSMLVLMRFQMARWVLADPPYLKPIEAAWLHYPKVLRDFQQLMPPLFFFAALLSFAGMKASREWGWRAFSRLFVLFYGVWLLTLLFVWDTRFNPLVLLYVLLLFVLLVGNLCFCRRGSWSSEEVGEGPDGWVIADLLMGPLMLLRTLRTRRRALYSNGVAVRGSLHVLDYAPHCGLGGRLAHDFFTLGTQFNAQVRFSTEGSDEAALAMRGAALQLQCAKRGDFELTLGTGAHCPAENIVTFALMVLARMFGGTIEARFWKYYPRMRERFAATLRRAPESYARLHYHSQTVRFWVSREGHRHLVRYRLIPNSYVPSLVESGLPALEPGQDQERMLDRQRLPAERRPTDYLQQEMKRRLEGTRTCTLWLEAQFHSPHPSDNEHWFNPSVDWHTKDHPWMRIGLLTLEEVIPDEQAELLSFNPANVPPSLGTPISKGLLDYRSIADSEKRVHQRIQRTRQWMARTLGPPSP